MRIFIAASVTAALFFFCTSFHGMEAFGDANAQAQGTTSTLTVNSQDSFGNQVTGFYIELYHGDGMEQDAFTPHTFMLADNQTYFVHVENYGMYRFSHWLATGSSQARRLVSIYSDKQITAVYDVIPAHPANLTATAVSPNQINLKWSAPLHNGTMPVTGYRIQRSLDDRAWTTIARNTESASTAYSDTGLNSDTTYYYRVFALSQVGSSYRSNVADAMTPLPSVAVNDTSIGPIVIVQPTFGR